MLRLFGQMEMTETKVEDLQPEVFIGSAISGGPKKKGSLKLRRPKAESPSVLEVPKRDGLLVVEGGIARSASEPAPEIKIYNDFDFPVRDLKPFIPTFNGKEKFDEDLKGLTPPERRAVILNALNLKEEHTVPYPDLDIEDPDFDKKFDFDLWMNDYRYGIESFMKIVTKDQGIRTFKLNVPQLAFYFNRTGRDVILKGRQHGLTTLIIAIYLLDTMLNKGRKTAIVTHEKPATETLLATIKMMYESIPEPLRPPLVKNNAEMMEFEGMDGSSIRVETIKKSSTVSSGSSERSGGAGRSKMYHNLLLSEPAFYDGVDDKDLLGLTQAVPVSDNSSLTLESTPNGNGGFFHKQAKHARSGNANRKFFILHWFVNPEYDEKWKFIRRKDLELLEGTPEGDRNWAQEYECNFNMSQNNFFEPNLWEPRASVTERKTHDPMGVYYEPYIHIFQEPVQDHLYVIGADCAQGLDHGDYSSATVLDRETGEEVAHIHGHIEPDEFAEVLFWLGYKYNEAFLGVENEKNGAVVLHELMTNDKIIYRNLYFYVSNEALRRDTIGVPGFTTNSRSRRVMLNKFKKDIRTEAVFLAFSLRREEMSTFVIIDGKPQAASKSDNDDTIISGGIATFLLDQPETIIRDEENEIGISEVGY